MSMKGDSADGKCNQLHSVQTTETIILHVTGTFTVHWLAFFEALTWGGAQSSKKKLWKKHRRIFAGRMLFLSLSNSVKTLKETQRTAMNHVKQCTSSFMI